MKVSLQLYSLRNFGDLNDQLALCKKYGLQYVELRAFHDLKKSEVEAALAKQALSISSLHCSVQFLGQNFADVAALLTAHQAQFVVVPWFFSHQKEDWLAFGQELGQLAAQLARHNLKLAYHHHEHEFFLQFDHQGTTVNAIDLLLNRVPDLYLQCDVAWTWAGRQDPVAYLSEKSDRIRQIHVKDLGFNYAAKGEFPRRMGQGIMPLSAIVSQAKKIGVTDFILEMDNPSDCEQFVESGVKLLEQLL